MSLILSTESLQTTVCGCRDGILTIAPDRIGASIFIHPILNSRLRAMFPAFAVG